MTGAGAAGPALVTLRFACQRSAGCAARNHETGDPWPGPYKVTTGPSFTGGVSAPGIAKIVAAHPETTFKLKVDSCYSGRMLDPEWGLKKLRNLLVAETSNNSDELGSFDIETSSGKPAPNRLIPNPEKIQEFTNGDLYGMTLFLQSQDPRATHFATPDVTNEGPLRSRSG